MYTVSDEGTEIQIGVSPYIKLGYFIKYKNQNNLVKFNKIAKT